MMTAPERESAYFDDSRRLTGPNLYFVETGAVLEALGPASHDPVAHALWQKHVEALAAALGWALPSVVARPHRASTSLALSAPLDQLFTATEINEWAWESATAERYPALGVSNAFEGTANDVGDFAAALTRLRARSKSEANGVLTELVSAASAAGVSVYLDDQTLSIGGGATGKSWPVQKLPIAAPDLQGLQDVPIALVTGSNGKTTTVRLIAAMLTASGKHPGYSCTEGVFVAGEQAFSGDYSGPAGARAVLRDARVDAAVLETARGGMLRRGLAAARADVAVVTNISADHFGEYGIESLDDLADVKLIVARAVGGRGGGMGEKGTLVLNGDDPVLMRRSSHLWPKVAVFAGVFENAFVARKVREGGLACAIRDGHLRLVDSGEALDLGHVNDMPLAAGGAATYNIANMAAAALAARAMHVPVSVIRDVLTTFGQSRSDNPGRLEQWEIDGVHVLLDYAHNPAGLAGLMSVARAIRAKSKGRIGLLLGQAGNREDDDVKALATMAASFAPDVIVLKDIDGMLRGRAPGEVPAMLRESLLNAGIDVTRIQTTLAELDAAKQLFHWAQPGDVVVMPMHGVAPRVALRAWLDAAANPSS